MKFQSVLFGIAAIGASLLAACVNHIPSGEKFARTAPLIQTQTPIVSASYTADYTEDGKRPFSCEVILRSDNLMRRAYIWKDDEGKENRVTVLTRNGRSYRIDTDGKVSELDDAATALANFFGNLIVAPSKAVVKASFVYETINNTPVMTCWLVLPPNLSIDSCRVTVDQKSKLWSAFQTESNDHSLKVSSSFPEYQNISGTIFPSKIVSQTNAGGVVVCVIHDVKINPELPDGLFELPADPKN